MSAVTMDEAARRFLVHVELEQGRSKNTVTAYGKDIAGMLEFSRGRGCEALGDIGIAELRGWLAAQRSAGLSSTTMARRATAVRMFFARASSYISRACCVLMPSGCSQ